MRSRARGNKHSLMANPFRLLAALGVAAIAACSATPGKPAQRVSVHVSCEDRAASLINANERAVANRNYALASGNAERAARISLSCGDRWRAANELIVAAELAHQQGDVARARGLVREGFGIMKRVRSKEVTSSLLAQQMNSAQRDLSGSWTLW